MVRLILILILASPILLSGQEKNNSVVREGLLRAQGTFSFGKLLKLEEAGLYLHGNMEYYFDDKFSVRGDIFYHLKDDELNWIDMNHQLYSGVSYHFPAERNFTGYIGLQPGIALTRLSSNIQTETLIKPLDEPTALTFLYSSVIGFNYYAEDWFHLFVDARLVGGMHFNQDISEVRLSFGLGFNFNTK